jgi:hypothetical protein
MTHAVRTIAVVIVALAFTHSVAEAQWPPFVGIPGTYGIGGFGGYGPYGGYGNGSLGGFGGYGQYGGYGNGPMGGFGGYGQYGSIGNGPYGGYGGGYGGYGGGYGGYGGYGGGYGGYGGGYGGYGGGYGPLNYSQQLYQQQSSLTQQIFQQQQQAILGQIRDAQNRLVELDAAKQRVFQQYLAMSDSDKATVRTGRMNDYLKLDARGREGWKRDAVAQIVVGQDLQRLDGLAQFRDMSEPDKVQFRQSMLQKYRSLSPADQQIWRNDPIVTSIMGSEWWLK